MHGSELSACKQRLINLVLISARKSRGADRWGGAIPLGALKLAGQSAEMLRYFPRVAQRPLIIIDYFWLLSAANDVATGIRFVV